MPAALVEAGTGHPLRAMAQLTSMADEQRCIADNKEVLMSAQSREPKKPRGATGVAIPAGLLIGLGVGFLFDHVAAGCLIGLGGGFLLMMILRIILGEW